jgi:hypothetical protein
MPTECNAELFEFTAVDSRAVVAGFDGGAITSDAGALLLGATNRAIRLIGRFADCFIDRRRLELVEHFVPTLVGQRVFGPRRAAARPGDGGAGRQAGGAS